MKLIQAILFCFVALFSLNAQQNFNLELLANVTYQGNGNDVWGYVDQDGTEYAIVGSTVATLIYSLEDPSNPVLRTTIPGANSTWRDMKSWKKHVYVTTDSGQDGLLIINMEGAPDNITSFYWKPTFTIGNETDVLKRVHNLYIDEKGVCYLSGHNLSTGGIIFLDVDTDPEAPILLGYEDERYSHDVFVRGDTMYTSEIYQGQLGIYDISDKASPKLLATRTTSTLFTHNSWLSDNGKYVFTTDEKPNAYVDAYDISDLSNISRLDKYQPQETAGKGVIPHNTHYKDGFLVTSWYTDGVVITDAHYPDNMIKAGAYDTYLGPDGGFSGCWGVYPWLPSGIILANDINNGFFVLGATYKQACYLEGKVNDEGTGNPISDVKVEINSGDKPLKNTNATGDYKTGQMESGTFDVSFSHPSYYPKTVSAELINGQVTILDVELTAKPTYSVNIETVKAGSGEALPKAQVILFNDEISYTFATDNDGKYSDVFIEGEYEVIAGQWGYYHAVISSASIDQEQTLTIELEKGYQDDFIFDLGWNVDNTATDGAWERGVPNPTFYNGSASNVDADVPNDLGDQCYVTGNGGGNPGQDDVDNGRTTLISDFMDLSWYNEPIVEYYAWFYNDGGSVSQPNDSLIIKLSNGSETVILEEITNSMGEWRPKSSFVVSDFISITDKMTISFETMDQEQNGHLVEAGVDAFFVREGDPISGIQDLELTTLVTISPNPSTDHFTIQWLGEKTEEYQIEMFNVTGKSVYKSSKTGNAYSVYGQGLSDGVYVVQITNSKGQNQSLKWIKQAVH